MSGGQGVRSLILTNPFCLYHTDIPPDNINLVIVILVITLLIVLLAGLTLYLYNRQRKIRRYELQRAQEEAMKLKAQAPPP